MYRTELTTQTYGPLTPELAPGEALRILTDGPARTIVESDCFAGMLNLTTLGRERADT